MKAAEAAALAEKIRTAVRAAVVGREVAVDQILVGLLADGHLLLEDMPGLGKTLMAKSFAAALGLDFQRVQFTADLLPHDITGAEILDPRSGGFVFRPGPIFTNVLLADEINRAPPKVQSALLESMQEYQVTSERTTYPLPRPFLVLATENPIELEGTYALPEAQVDRFLLRLRVGYPTVDEERTILARRRTRKTENADVLPVTNREAFLELQHSVEEIELESSVAEYLIDLVRATRADPRAEVGASPRGSLALQKLVRARALLLGRDYVLPDDVKALALPALAHRIVVKPEPWIRGVRGEDVVRNALEKLAVPKTR
ncbi:MAG: MoxR family ATPase [Thermoplasmata archaeon]|jgi:MoxR-like ATPase|nr:MoxR family ATPase [Thermoplasmata archaeon]